MQHKEINQLSLAQVIFSRRQNGESIEDIAENMQTTVENVQFLYDMVVVAVLSQKLEHEKGNPQLY